MAVAIPFVTQWGSEDRSGAVEGEGRIGGVIEYRKGVVDGGFGRGGGGVMGMTRGYVGELMSLRWILKLEGIVLASCGWQSGACGNG